MNAYQVGPETFVSLRCQVYDAEGEPAAEPELLATVFGFGQLLAAVERSIESKVAGDVVEAHLKPDDAYGRRDPKAILEVERSEFPPSVAVGDRFDVENEAGGLLVVQVLEVDAERVVLDTNHPLADQDVKIQVEILEVRPASQVEMEAAEAQLSDDADFHQKEQEARNLASTEGARTAQKPSFDVGVTQLVRGEVPTN